MFAYHLEARFEGLLDPNFSFIWKLLNREAPTSVIEVWYWCLLVVRTFQRTKDPDSSIEKIYHVMLDTAREDMASGGIECRPTDNDKRHVLQAIFAVLCWTSATLKPLVGANATRPAAAAPPLHDPNTTEEGSSNASSKSTVLSAENCSRIYSSSNTRRPIGSLFHTYRSRSHAAHSREQGTLETTLGGVDTQTASSTFEDMLYEPGLTYHSLLMAGHVQIRWVDTLTAHLYFNRSTRELSVFRYPSICAARIYSVQNIKVLERCVIQLNMHLACDESPY